ncbi:MAG: potassium-transporting ATPase subunit KdpB [Brevinematales bacterium]
MLDALKESFIRLNPYLMLRNIVMFVVEIGAFITTAITIINIVNIQPYSFNLNISLWLWFTVIFSNFAEAIAESRGKAQTEALKSSRSTLTAQKISEKSTVDNPGEMIMIPALNLKKGDYILVSKGELIAGDGEIVQGTALVDESAITGESAPVIRESGGDRSGITGGTRIIEGIIKIRITANPGESFLDTMISMVESAKRQKTPNEIALEILLVALTVLFIVVVATLIPYDKYTGVYVSIPVLISLLVCLMPTTIGALLPAIGIAGMDRLIEKNVIAFSGRAVEASGDVSIVLLDKTGTITLGNRMAKKFIPADGVAMEDLAKKALYSSLADETPEGRSILSLAKETLNIRGRDITDYDHYKFIPFTPESRMSGVDMNGVQVWKGAYEAIEHHVLNSGGKISDGIKLSVKSISEKGGTPLVVAEGNKVLGVIQLTDILKTGISERLAHLRKMGIKSVMITGDNQLTAAAIAAEAGIDDFVAQARPEAKLEMIRKYQADGYLVAMIGDGTNDAPALAQADVAVAMNAGTQVAREASNMIDLDSNPTKLLDIVEIGKEILITRGAMTTFSIANDVSKYFAIVPAMFMVAFPALGFLNIMRLSTPESAVLAAIIFNAIIIPMLIPLSLRFVKYKTQSPASLLSRNLLIYGLGGVILPFPGIKIIDMILNLFR